MELHVVDYIFYKEYCSSVLNYRFLNFLFVDFRIVPKCHQYKSVVDVSHGDMVSINKATFTALLNIPWLASNILKYASFGHLVDNTA